VRRRDFAIGLLLASAVSAVSAQEPAKQHRIAVVIPSGPAASINDTPFYQAIFAELRRLGDVEGQNLAVERYSGEGRPQRFDDLARQVVNGKPDAVVAITNPVAQAVRAATRTIPIVWIGGEPVQAGFATSLARPGGNITGVTGYYLEIWGKRLQILKEAVPSASKVAFLALHGAWEGRRTRAS
jgi:putative tryptophan/tyrosine transport system substrate-binding protein